MDLMRNLVNRTEPGSFLFTWLFSGFLICTSAKLGYTPGLWICQVQRSSVLFC